MESEKWMGHLTNQASGEVFVAICREKANEAFENGVTSEDLRSRARELQGKARKLQSDASAHLAIAILLAELENKT